MKRISTIGKYRAEYFSDYCRKQLRKTIKKSKGKKESTLLKGVLHRVGSIIETVFVPFGKQLKLAENLELTRKQYQESTKGILDSRKPKRPPRFFFKSKYLIPYSSMKAKL